MSKPKHTPGPWCLLTLACGDGILVSKEVPPGVGNTGGYHNIASVYDENDGGIIAAAPDMLKALKNCITSCDNCNGSGGNQSDACHDCGGYGCVFISDPNDVLTAIEKAEKSDN